MPLIVFEGLQGSGKTTAIKALESILKEHKESYFITSWNSSDEINPIIQDLKIRKNFNSTIMSLLHASDLLLRYENEIKPNLSKNNIVIADRYIYTSYARDCIRGVSPELLDNIYKDIIEPDIIFYLNVSVETAIDRKLRTLNDSQLEKYYYYNSGMDVTGLDLENSMYKYKSELKKRYENMFLNKENVVMINGESTTEEIIQTIYYNFLKMKEKRGK